MLAWPFIKKPLSRLYLIITTFINPYHQKQYRLSTHSDNLNTSLITWAAIWIFCLCCIYWFPSLSVFPFSVFLPTWGYPGMVAHWEWMRGQAEVTGPALCKVRVHYLCCPPSCQHLLWRVRSCAISKQLLLTQRWTSGLSYISYIYYVISKSWPLHTAIWKEYYTLWKAQ